MTTDAVELEIDQLFNKQPKGAFADRESYVAHLNDVASELFEAQPSGVDISKNQYRAVLLALQSETGLPLPMVETRLRNQPGLFKNLQA